MYDWETFQAAYKAAPDDKKIFAESTVMPGCVRQIIATKHLDESHYHKVVKLYLLFLLEAITEETMLVEMRKLGIPDGKIVFYSLQICLEENKDKQLSDLAREIAETEKALKDATENTNHKIPETPPSTTSDTLTKVSNPSTTTNPTPVPKIPSLNEEVVHSSTQPTFPSKN